MGDFPVYLNKKGKNKNIMYKTYLNNIIEWSVLLVGIFFAFMVLWMIIQVPQVWEKFIWHLGRIQLKIS
jgi:formate-dependent nitrite reductase membrane component NrfD